MDEKENQKIKKFNIRRIIVFCVILFFAVSAIVINRAEYLKIKEISENYTSIFFKNFYLKTGMFCISFVVTFLLFYINNRIIKKGMKTFFEEDGRQVPKLPNKSISLIAGITAGIYSLKVLYTKYIMCANATSFGIEEKIFGNDISFYMFILPFIKSFLIYLLSISLIMVIYTAIYYVVAINVCFENGVDLQSLKKNTFIKQIKFWAFIFGVIISVYIWFTAQDVLTGDMISMKNETGTELTGAGVADVSIKLWGYRIFAIIVLISVILIIKNVRSI